MINLQLNHCNITVFDMERSLAFYRDLLGLNVVVDVIREGDALATGVGVPGAKLRNVKFAFGNGAAQLELAQYLNVNGKPLPPHAIYDFHYGHVCFETEDIGLLYENLLSKGVRFISPPQTMQPAGIKFCYAYDPDDNVVEFASYPH